MISPNSNWLGDAPDRLNTPAPLPSPRAAALVQHIRRTGELRNRYFDPNLFSDPAWEILLDLYEGHLNQLRLQISTLGRARGVPPTTALRWLNALEAGGLIQRTRLPWDRRRVFISLSLKGQEAMDRLFADLDRETSAL